MDTNLKPLNIPLQRQPPARLTGDAAAYQPTSVSQYYMPQYFELVDTATSLLKERFSASADLKAYGQLENILLSGTISDSNVQCISTYPEVRVDDLKIQLAMFHRKYTIKNVNDAAVAFREMVPEVKELFCDVNILLRLLLVCPASSAEAERSFSRLRRLKTWLRSTMSQKRLNSICVCHIHQDLLDAADIIERKEFCSRSDFRVKQFEHF